MKNLTKTDDNGQTDLILITHLVFDHVSLKGHYGKSGMVAKLSIIYYWREYCGSNCMVV